MCKLHYHTSLAQIIAINWYNHWPVICRWPLVIKKDEPIKSIYPIILRLSSETNLAGQNCILLSGSHLTNQKHLSDISLITMLTHFSSQTKLSHYPAIWKSSEKQSYVSRHMSGRQKTGLCTDLTQWSYLLIKIKEHPALIIERDVLVSS